MIAKAKARFVRISPRKVRYVIDLIRAKNVPAARVILSGTPRRAGGIVEKLLNQAIDAAEKNAKIPAKDLVISKVLADGGPTMRRFRAMSMGRAGVIRKRTSHIYLELDLAKNAVRPEATAPVSKGRKAKAQPAQKAAEKKSGKKLAGAK